MTFIPFICSPLSLFLYQQIFFHFFFLFCTNLLLLLLTNFLSSLPSLSHLVSSSSHSSLPFLSFKVRRYLLCSPSHNHHGSKPWCECLSWQNNCYMVLNFYKPSRKQFWIFFEKDGLRSRDELALHSWSFSNVMTKDISIKTKIIIIHN